MRRGAVPVAHDQRPRGLRLLRRRHRAVPHRRRRRVRPRPVRPGHRRHRPAVPARRRAAGRDRPDVGRARLLLRPPRRQFRHQQGDRARRVRHRRRQQPVHEPDGRREPPPRRGRRRPGAHRVSVRPPPGGRAAPGSPTTRWRCGGERPSGCTSRTTRPPASTSRTTASCNRRRGTSPAHRRSTTRCCSTTTRSSSTGTRSSSRPTSCWPRSCCPTGSRAEERQRIFEYYDPLTTGDSSLSESVQAIAAADAGKYRTAEEYLRRRGRGRHGRHGRQPPRRRSRRVGRRHVDGRGVRLRRVPLAHARARVRTDPPHPGPARALPAAPARVGARGRHRGDTRSPTG